MDDAGRGIAGLQGGAGGSAVSARLQGSYGGLRGLVKDGHHIIQHSPVRDLTGYDKYKAPAVHLVGPSTRVGTEHYGATRVQEQRGGGTYAAERRIAYKALRRAGIIKSEARELIAKADEYFGSLGVTLSTPLRIPGNRR